MKCFPVFACSKLCEKAVEVKLEQLSVVHEQRLTEKEDCHG